MAHIAVARLHAPVLNLLTATPMIDRPIDLLGLLHLIWKSEFSNPEDKSHSDSGDGRVKGPSQLEKFKEAKTSMMTTALSSPDDMERYLGFLDPCVFAALMASPDGGQMDPYVANTVIPVILSLLQLRRTLATTINLGSDRGSVTIGGTIPYAKWT